MATRSQDDLHRTASSDAGTDERTLYDHSSDEGYDGRPSGELSQNDHDILDSEDEREKLLTQNQGKKGFLGRKGSGVKVGKWVKEKAKARRKGSKEESSALMYDMEEGTGASSTSFIPRNSESDERRLLANESQRRVSWVNTSVCTLKTNNGVGTEKGHIPSDMHIHSHSCSFRRPPRNCIQPIYPARCQRRCRPGIEWYFAICAYHNPHISRWLSRRFSVPQPYAHTQSVCTRGHIAQVHAT